MPSKPRPACVVALGKALHSDLLVDRLYVTPRSLIGILYIGVLKRIPTMCSSLRFTFAILLNERLECSVKNAVFFMVILFIMRIPLTFRIETRCDGKHLSLHF